MSFRRHKCMFAYSLFLLRHQERAAATSLTQYPLQTRCLGH